MAMIQITVIVVSVCATFIALLAYRVWARNKEQENEEKADSEIAQAESDLEDALQTNNLAIIANARDNLVRVRKRFNRS